MNTFRMGALKNSSDFRDESDIEIDVDGVDGVESETENPFPYDFYKARDVMNECEKYVEFARDNDTGDNWESKVLRYCEMENLKCSSLHFIRYLVSKICYAISELAGRNLKTLCLTKLLMCYTLKGYPA